MLILHAVAWEASLALWAETSPAEAGPRPRGRRPKTQGVRPHPHAAGADQLSQALSQAGLELARTGLGRPETVSLWLPTADEKPCPSSPLLEEMATSKSELRISPWAVTALILPGDALIELLCLCQGRTTLGPGVVVGPDLAHWAGVLRFAGSLAARGRCLPGLERRGDRYLACWQPILTGRDAEDFNRLAQAMPAAGRAASRPEVSAPPQRPATEAFRPVLSRLLDALVRQAGSGQSSQGKSRLAARGTRRFDSLHDQWAQALVSSDGLMAGDEADLAALAGQVQAWRRPMTEVSAAPFRLSFRLDEPDGESAEEKEEPASPGPAWRVHFFLQGTEDPSLFLPAAEVWKTRGRKGANLPYDQKTLRQHLLLGLGQAAGICPRIENSLKSSDPVGYDLDAVSAFEFLSQRAAALEAAGFGVLLPAWWTGQGTKTRLSLKARIKSPAMKSGSGLSLDELVSVDWQVALGGEAVSLKELQALARLKSPLVRLRGQWVQVGQQEIQAALEALRKVDGRKMTGREALGLALGQGSGPGGLPVAGAEAQGWIEEVLAGLTDGSGFEELGEPAGFSGQLRPYQRRGYSWMNFLRRWGLGALLADDMGLGKTVQTLALIQNNRFRGKTRPALLVCPTSVVGNWQREAARFTPDLAVLVHHGLGRSRAGQFRKAAEGHGLVVSSYALLHRDLDFFKEVNWSAVILDEAQNIKNPETKQARAARSIEASHRVALTGTPVENNLGDLWSIMDFLNPGLLGGKAEFKKRFFVPIQAGRDQEALSRLRSLTRPFTLRRLKTDRAIAADLPEKNEIKVFCRLTKEQASLYAAVVEEALSGLDETAGIQRKGLVLAMLAKLKQVCNHPAQFLKDQSAIPGRSGKLARLTEMLEEVLESKERALIFTQFAEMGHLLRRHLQEVFGREVLFLHGQVPKAKRDDLVERFQSEIGPGLFVLSLKAGGTGLNLTRANHVFHFDRWWNPAVENQATDRAFRIGQTRNVQVYKYVCAGTLEERIDQMIERKKELAELAVGAGEGWLTELSTAELRKLLVLDREAVGEQTA